MVTIHRSGSLTKKVKTDMNAMTPSIETAAKILSSIQRCSFAR